MYILLFKVWEPDTTAFVVSGLRPGDAFIDVGANIGYFSLLASSCVGEAGRVVAIDASPSNYAELKYNVEANNAANIRAMNAAAGEKKGVIEVFWGPSHNAGMATTSPGTRRGLRAEARIEAAPLGELLQNDEIRRARLLKIDIEGAEPGVVAGLRSFLAAANPDLEVLLELSPQWWADPALSPEDVIRPFREAGFHTYVIDNNYMVWRYLWPNAVRPPRRIDRLPDRSVKQIDIVLSRVDARELSRA